MRNLDPNDIGNWSLVSTIASLALLAVTGCLGVALLRRFTTDLTTLEQLAYGVPLGAVISSLIMLFAACLAGRLGLAIVVGTGLASLAAAAATVHSSRSRGAASARCATKDGSAGEAITLGAALVLAAFVVRWALLWHGALTIDSKGLWAGFINIWGDWAQHLGDVTSFAYGNNFPPTNPRLAGHALAYHYLSSITVAAMVRLGMSPIAALPLHSFAFSVAIALGLFAFARRMTLRSADAALAVTLFLLGGGLGWWLALGDAFGAPSPLHALWQHPWNRALQEGANIQWQNVYFSLIAPQRAYLYGLPLALLIFTLLLQGVRGDARRPFIVAGVVAGLLPFAHLSTLLALAVITPWIFLLFPSWRWVWFFAAWVAIAVPQLYLQQSGGAGALAAMRVQLGWMAGHEGWVWFWLKNLGVFLPLLAVALFRDRLLPAPHRRFLLGFMPAFVIANVVVFQPWDWDNTKVLVVWYLGASIFVAVMVASLWRAHRSAAARVAIGALVASMILSGIMVNVNQLLGRDRNLMASPEALELARAVRSSTPSDALFLTDLQHNNPIPMLAGRHVVMGYPGWLWSQGYSYQSREADVRAMFALASGADTLLNRYGVDYVVIGPTEREKLGADAAAYEARYPRVLHVGDVEVFATGTRSALR